jgi:hypothetical protein
MVLSAVRLGGPRSRRGVRVGGQPEGAADLSGAAAAAVHEAAGRHARGHGLCGPGASRTIRITRTTHALPLEEVFSSGCLRVRVGGRLPCDAMPPASPCPPLAQAIPELSAVLGLCLFLFVLFGIMAVQLFGGALHARCRLTPWPVTRGWAEGSDPAAFMCLPPGSSPLDVFSVTAQRPAWAKADSPWATPAVRFMGGTHDNTATAEALCSTVVAFSSPTMHWRYPALCACARLLFGRWAASGPWTPPTTAFATSPTPTGATRLPPWASTSASTTRSGYIPI